MHLKDFKGTLISEGGPTPIQIDRVDSSTSLLNFFKPEGTSMEFSGAKPEGSKNPGLSGRVELKSEDGGQFHLNAKIDGLDFGEIEWMNPDNLRGASGLFTGAITSDGKFSEDPKFQLILASRDGLVQAKFFSALLPYLPALPTKDRLTKLAAKDAVLPFKNAAVRAELKEPHKMTIALHIEIPDYNVVLNINFEIRIEESLSFLQLAEIMGLVKVTV